MSRPEFNLQGKVALITGATGGIGSAIAVLFGRAGARVLLTSRSEQKLRTLVGDLVRLGVEAGCLAIDLCAAGAPAELASRAVEQMGSLDILVNNAGINRPQKAEEVSEADWDAIMNTNLRSLFFLSQAVGRHMIEKGGGKIINISSDAGLVALPLRAAYCASKAAVNALTRSLALEWAPYNIKVNAVAPTFVETPFVSEMFKDPEFKQYVLDSIPLARMATVGEIAHAALYLACDFADIVTGHVLVADGGWTVK